MDSNRFPSLLASDAVDETPAKDSLEVDDGNARRFVDLFSLLYWVKEIKKLFEGPGLSVPPHPSHPSYGSPTEMPKHISSIGANKSKMEVMELSDLHHPNCKMNRKINSGGGDLGADHCRRESESSDSILLSPEASKATEAVEFIAEHLRNEDLYIQVSLLSREILIN